MAKFTGRTAEQIERDHDRDNFLLRRTPPKSTVSIDKVLQKRVPDA